MSFFERLKQGLNKTRQVLSERVNSVLAAGAKLEPVTFEELEASLLSADLGAQVSGELMEYLRQRAGYADADAASLKPLLARAIKEFLLKYSAAAPENFLTRSPRYKPEIIMAVGVNGTGKTTTCGKLAYRYSKDRGDKVLLVAGDTFRAAAEEQLELWAQRAGADFFAQATGADPSSVAFDAISKAVTGAYTRVILDTAGRLQTKTNLMEELKKVHRVCGKALAGAPHEILLVMDAGTGQNMLSQVKLFNEAVPLSGLIITKLDGSAKAGAVLSIVREYKIPIRLIGVGEKLEDLQPFDPVEFAEAIAGAPSDLY